MEETEGAEKEAGRNETHAQAGGRRAADEEVQRTLALLGGSLPNLVALIENAPDVLSRFDRDLRYLFINKTAERNTGIPREAFIGRTFRELGFPEENCRLWEEALRHIFATGEPCLIEFSLELPGVGLRHYEGTSVAERGPDGAIETVLTVTRDVTASREAALALSASEERFRIAATLASDNIYEWDLRTNELRWFGDVARRLGYTPEELPATFDSFLRVLHPDDAPRLKAVLDRTLESGGGYREEVRLIARDGSIRYFVDHAQVIRDTTTGKAIRLLGVNTDITEQRRAEEVIREAAARQRLFLREMLFSMTEGRLRLCETESDLPAPLSPAPTDEPLELTRGSLQILRRQLEQRAEAAGLALDRAQDLITGVGEAAMNAVVHAGGGAAEIYADPERGTIQVWVRDSGTGITEDAIHRATLERGWTTADTLGHGFWMILRTCDRIYLLTGPEGTTVVLEQEQKPPPPAWMVGVV